MTYVFATDGGVVKNGGSGCNVAHVQIVVRIAGLCQFRNQGNQPYEDSACASVNGFMERIHLFDDVGPGRALFEKRRNMCVHDISLWWSVCVCGVVAQNAKAVKVHESMWLQVCKLGCKFDFLFERACGHGVAISLSFDNQRNVCVLGMCVCWQHGFVYGAFHAPAQYGLVNANAIKAMYFVFIGNHNPF